MKCLVDLLQFLVPCSSVHKACKGKEFGLSHDGLRQHVNLYHILNGLRIES